MNEEDLHQGPQLTLSNEQFKSASSFQSQSFDFSNSRIHEGDQPKNILSDTSQPEAQMHQLINVQSLQSVDNFSPIKPSITNDNLHFENAFKMLNEKKTKQKVIEDDMVDSMQTDSNMEEEQKEQKSEISDQKTKINVSFEGKKVKDQTHNEILVLNQQQVQTNNDRYKEPSMNQTEDEELPQKDNQEEEPKKTVGLFEIFRQQKIDNMILEKQKSFRRQKTQGQTSPILPTRQGTMLLTLNSNQDEEQDLVEKYLQRNRNLKKELEKEDQKNHLEEQEMRKRELIEKMKDDMKVNDDDIERELREKAVQENQEEQEDDPFESHFFNIFNVILSLLYIVMILTECDFSSQQKIGQIMVNMFDNEPFDESGTTRPDIGSADQIYYYLKDLMIPKIFNETAKIADSNPYIDPSEYTDENETIHYINNYNYFVGMRFTYKRIDYVQNEEEKSRIVLPYKQPQKYEVAGYYPDYREDIPVANSSKIYKFEFGTGAIDKTGSYSEIILGNKNFAEALEYLEDMNNAGWFNNHDLLYFGVSMMTYNINYDHCGFFSFYHYRDITGTLVTRGGRFSTIYPTLYDEQENSINDNSLTNPKILMRIIIIGYHIKVFCTNNKWGLEWYYYLDIIIYALNSQSLYYWFMNLSTRAQFHLPFQSEAEFEYWTENQIYIRTFLLLSPIATLFLCFKNLQIFSVYFPAFGVLFDTIKKSKNNAISFFIMTIILSFGYIVSGIIQFGDQLESFSTISNSALSLFFIVMQQAQTGYSELEGANNIAAPLYYFSSEVLFQIILINMFITLIITQYDRIRSQKQLQSEAIAKILIKDYKWSIHLWANLLLCRLDRRTKEEVIVDTDEEEDEDGTKMRARILEKHYQFQREQANKKNDLRTTFLYNKVQLFSKQQMKSKEMIEAEIFENKKKIIKRKKMDIINRILRFKTVDKRFYQELKLSVFYFMYIVVFVTLIVMQLDVQNIGPASQPLRLFMEGGQFDPIESFSPVDPSNEENSGDVSNLRRILRRSKNIPNITEILNKREPINFRSGGGGNIDEEEEEEEGDHTEYPESIFDIRSATDIESWILNKYLKYIYKETGDDHKFLSQNYFFGNNRVKITMRRFKLLNNNKTSVNSIIPKVRQVKEITGDSDVDYKNEGTLDFRGKVTNQWYNYTKPGNVKAYGKAGGYVRYLPKDRDEAHKIVKLIFKDMLIQKELSSLVLEIVTYNPNFRIVVLTKVSFDFSETGMIVPDVVCRAFRTNPYQTSSDRFRAFLEIIFTIYIIIQNIKQMKYYLKLWKEIYIFVYFLLVNFYYWVKWIVKATIRSIQVFIMFLTKNTFQFLSFISLILCNFLIVNWIMILSYFNIEYDESGNVISDPANIISSEEEKLSQIDFLSYVAYILEYYILLAAINALITFFRMFQFFQFSIKLSAFTEILKSSKSDVGYFLIMFVLILIGYAVMASSFYGENLVQYSDLIATVMKLFQMMNTSFDYAEFADYSPLSALFFVTFMIVFYMFLLNMLIGIIIAHYIEYEEQQILIKMNMNDQNSDFYRIMFGFLKEDIAPESFSESKFVIFRLWHRFWAYLDYKINGEHGEDNETEEQIKEFKKELSSKYKKPEYGPKDIHLYVRSYMNQDEEDLVSEDSDSIEDIYQNKSQEMENQSDQKAGSNQKEEKKEANAMKKRLIKRFLKNPEGRVYTDLKIGVLGDFAEANQDQKTSTAYWMAALEEELFIVSNFEILYTQLLDNDDKYHREEYFKIHDYEKFDSYQAQFLAYPTVEEKAAIWKSATLQQKYKLWEIMDYEKIIEDCNRNTGEESIDYFFEFTLNAEKHINVKNADKPLLTFKKIMKSPEYLDKEFSRASITQKQLWNEHTTHKERFYLWFYLFGSYYRTKLWNRLQFNEDYIFHITNSQELSRQDLVIFIMDKIDRIRSEYLSYLVDKLELLYEKRAKLMSLRANLNSQSNVLEKIKDLEVEIIHITERHINLHDLVKRVPEEIKHKYIEVDFYLKIWEMLKEREYKEMIPNKGMSILQTLRMVANIQIEEVKQEPKKKIEFKNRTIIDQFDFNEQKELKTKLKKLRENSKYPTLFTPAPEPQVDILKILHTNTAELFTLGTKSASRRNSFNKPTASTKEPRVFTSMELSPIPSFENQGKKNVQFLGVQETEKDDNEAFSERVLETEEKYILPSKNSERINTLGSNNSSSRSQSQSQIRSKTTLFQTLKSKLTRQQTSIKSQSRKKRANQGNFQYFKEVKVNKLTHLKTMKTLFQLMIGGHDGRLMTDINKRCRERVKYLETNKKLDKYKDKQARLERYQLYFKYTQLTKSLDKSEERLALWLPLSMDDKMKMIISQHIDLEAEMMEMLVLEEIDWFNKGKDQLQTMDIALERALDNMTYEKYQKLTERQAFEMTLSQIEAALQKNIDQDVVLLEYIAFLDQKYRRMGQAAQGATKNLKRLKEINQRIEERITWKKEDLEIKKQQIEQQKKEQFEKMKQENKLTKRMTLRRTSTKRMSDSPKKEKSLDKSS